MDHVLISPVATLASMRSNSMIVHVEVFKETIHSLNVEIYVSFHMHFFPVHITVHVKFLCVLLIAALSEINSDDMKQSLDPIQ
jgi:hypothetical protein